MAAPSASQPSSRSRRSLFARMLGGVRWVGAGPANWAGVERIGRTASFIRALLSLLRYGLPADQRFKTVQGAFDVPATARDYGLTTAQLEVRLVARRRQTAQLSYAAFVLGWVFLLAWGVRAIATPWHAARVTAVVEFVPFCGVFFLVAFYNALLNYQIRMQRLVGWRDFLAAPEGFWPR